MIPVVVCRYVMLVVVAVAVMLIPFIDSVGVSGWFVLLVNINSKEEAVRVVLLNVGWSKLDDAVCASLVAI